MMVLRNNCHLIAEMHPPLQFSNLICMFKVIDVKPVKFECMLTERRNGSPKILTSILYDFLLSGTQKKIF